MRFRLLLSAVLLTAFVGSAALAQNDKVRIKGIDSGEEVVVAFNARKASGEGCLDASDADVWFARKADSAGEVKIGDLRRGCVLSFVAFSRQRAMLLTSLSGWKDQDGEVRTVTMKPPIEVPMVIWITDNELEGVAYSQVVKAAELYRKNMVGFNFVPTFRNVSGDQATVKIIESAVQPLPGLPDASVCTNVASLKGHAYKARTLNIYYVKRDGLHRNCAIRETPQCGDDLSDPRFRKVDGDVTYIGVPGVEVLAHELGHAFGLRPICNFGHPVLGPDIDVTNLMFGGGDDRRAKLTLGQIFRMNTQKDVWGNTMILANRLRRDPGRECRLPSQENYTYKCPPLTLSPPAQN